MRRLYMAERWFRADHVPPPIDGPYTIPFRFPIVARSRKGAEKVANAESEHAWEIANEGRTIAGAWAHDAVVLYHMGQLNEEGDCA